MFITFLQGSLPSNYKPSKKINPHRFHTKHLTTGPEGNSECCFLRILMFLETKSRETLRFEGNKIHCSPRDKSLSDLLYSKANGSNRWKTNNHVIDKWQATAVNILRVTVNCFPFDVIVFAMLPAHGIWQETVSLLHVMWQWTSHWMGGLLRGKHQLFNSIIFNTKVVSFKWGWQKKEKLTYVQ